MSKAKIMILIVMLALTTVLFFLSSDKKEIKGFKDAKEYAQQFAQTGNGQLKVFPDVIPDEAVQKDYYYYANTPPILSAKYQIHLKLEFSSKVSYDQEVSRLSELVGNSAKKIKVNDDFQGKKAFIAVMGEKDTYEYAVCDTDGKTIDYIYLQSIGESSVEFDKGLLPSDYGNVKEAYNIY